MKKKLHIIAFDVPFPANYGGVIDVFYRIKTLHALGIEITLHCFVYGDRKPQKDLENYCEKVFYYKRNKLSRQFWLPYIVGTRNHPELLKNLLLDASPILFEALHSCYFLTHPKLKGRIKLVRMHNIEHDYYALLAKAETKLLKKLYFQFESLLLKRFEKILDQADYIIAISEKDRKQLSEEFGSKVKLIQAFHGNSQMNSLKGKGDYCFYHGKLSVGENNAAALFLVKEVFSLCSIPLVVAGDGCSDELRKAINAHTHITLLEHLNPEQINTYIQNAQINVLPTFQPTGIKLKLINVLFNGRFILVNKQMVEETGLEGACVVANQAKEMANCIEKMMNLNFGQQEILQRSRVVGSHFDVTQNASQLIALLR